MTVNVCVYGTTFVYLYEDSSDRHHKNKDGNIVHNVQRYKQTTNYY